MCLPCRDSVRVPREAARAIAPTCQPRRFDRRRCHDAKRWFGHAVTAARGEAVRTPQTRVRTRARTQVPATVTAVPTPARSRGAPPRRHASLRVNSRSNSRRRSSARPDQFLWSSRTVATAPSISICFVLVEFFCNFSFDPARGGRVDRSRRHLSPENEADLAGALTITTQSPTQIDLQGGGAVPIAFEITWTQPDSPVGNIMDIGLTIYHPDVPMGLTSTTTSRIGGGSGPRTIPSTPPTMSALIPRGNRTTSSR